jgi:hypothetical protein
MCIEYCKLIDLYYEIQVIVYLCLQILSRADTSKAILMRQDRLTSVLAHLARVNKLLEPYTNNDPCHAVQYHKFKFVSLIIYISI